MLFAYRAISYGLPIAYLFLSSPSGIRCAMSTGLKRRQDDATPKDASENSRPLDALTDDIRTSSPPSGCPKEDTHEEEFASDPDWEDWSSDASQRWKTLLPLYQLARNPGFNNDEPYGIAMFHQLHCIVDIRQHYSSFLNVSGTKDEDRELAKDTKQRAHMAHCFNWLRQVGTFTTITVQI